MKPLILPSPFTRLLSTDFDGVFHGVHDGEEVFENGWMRIQGEGLFRWCHALERLLEGHPDVALAVHSSWRNHCEDEELARLLPPALRQRFLAATPRGLLRDESILFLVQELGNPAFCALDDDPDAFQAGFPNLVLCDPALGVQDPQALGALDDWLLSTAPAPKASKIRTG